MPDIKARNFILETADLDHAERPSDLFMEAFAKDLYKAVQNHYAPWLQESYVVAGIAPMGNRYIIHWLKRHHKENMLSQEHYADTKHTEFVFDFLLRIGDNETLPDEVRAEALEHYNTWNGKRMYLLQALIPELDLEKQDEEAP